MHDFEHLTRWSLTIYQEQAYRCYRYERIIVIDWVEAPQIDLPSPQYIVVSTNLLRSVWFDDYPPETSKQSRGDNGIDATEDQAGKALFQFFFHLSAETLALCGADNGLLLRVPRATVAAPFAHTVGSSTER